MFDILDEEYHRLAEIQWEAKNKAKREADAKWNEEQRAKRKPGTYIPYRTSLMIFDMGYVRGSIFHHLEDIHETVKSFINPRHYEYTICPCCDHAWSEEEQWDIQCNRQEGAQLPEDTINGKPILPGEIAYKPVTFPINKSRFD